MVSTTHYLSGVAQQLLSVLGYEVLCTSNVVLGTQEGLEEGVTGLLGVERRARWSPLLTCSLS